jgi:copper(I)-binding protein
MKNRISVLMAGALMLGCSSLSFAAPAMSAPAATYEVGSLRISSPWMRATPKGAKVAGGYLTITNNGTEADRLMSISSSISDKVEIHEMTTTNGVMKMRPVEAPLEIKPGATLELKPGGYHVMFQDLKKPVTQGERVKATLQFERAGNAEVEFAVAAVTANGPGAGGKMAPMPKM